MDDLIARIRQAARDDTSSRWFAVVDSDLIDYFEGVTGIELPTLLTRCYEEISNGGFGPGFHVAGLPGGHEAAWGDLIESVNELRLHDDCEDSLLPLIDCGCNEVLCLDCDDDSIITFLEGDFHQEEYTFETLMERWCLGEIPDLRTGEFYRPK